jgi:hypothetical protein
MQTHVADPKSPSEAAGAPVHRRRALIIAIVVLACLVTGVIVADIEWPFTRESVVASLQQQSGGAVQIGHFRETYFPHPGCVAEQVVFQGASNAAHPFITVDKLTVIGSYPGLLTRHLSSIRADGIHVYVARQQSGVAGSGPVNMGTLPPGMSIGEIIADGAAIEFAPTEPGAKAMIFRVPSLRLQDLADNQPLAYQATVEIPQPPVTVDVTGRFGPWRAGQGGESKMSGSYAVKSLDLGAFSGIQGILTATGNFDGTLQQVKVQGSANVPRFIVEQSGHSEALETRYVATVNGTAGDVIVDAAWAHFRNTTVVGAGSISGPGTQKTVTAEISSNNARIEDLLWMCVSDTPPAMTGNIVFRAKATLPPGEAPFLKKLQMQADFGVSNGQYPNPQTQQSIDVLSARARGQAGKVQDTEQKDGNTYDPGRVVSNLKGHGTASDGVAHLSNVAFDIPGASAVLSGTFGLQSQRIDMHGHMHMVAELSKTTTGFKSALIKVIAPFMHKSKRDESVVAITLGGTWDEPTYTAVPIAEK